jgi:RecB family exonuclease
MSGLPPLPRRLRLFPSRRAAARALVLEPGACVETSTYLTFDSLLKMLGALGGQRYAAPLFCRLVVRQLMAETPGWLAGAACDPYQVRGVTRALFELRAAGITAGHLANVNASPGLAMLALLLGRYETALERAGLADDTDWQRLGVLAAVRGELPVALRAVEEVTVEGGASLFGARLDLLSALAARGVRVCVRVPWDSNRASAFAYPGASLTALETRTQGIEVIHDARVGDGPLAALRAAQLTTAVAPGSPVRLLPVGSAEEGARWVALSVRQWLMEGVPADQICVATPDPDHQAQALVTALRAAGVPALSPRGERLADGVAGRVLDLALSLHERDVPREELLDLWTDLGRSVPIPGGELSPAEVVRWVRRAGARSTRVNNYKDALLRLAQREPHAPAAGLRALAGAIDVLVADLAALPEMAQLSRHIDAIVRLFEAHRPRLPESPLFVGDPAGSAPGHGPLLRAATREAAGQGAVDELMVELAQAARGLGAGAEWRRSEVHTLIRTLLFERRLGSEGLTVGSVAVLPLDDLVETRFRRVVLAGIEPDVFPRVREPDGILTEELRVEINQGLGPRLLQTAASTGHGGLHAAARDVWLWLEALAATEEALLVTFATPSSDEGLSEVVEELQRSLGGCVLDEPRASYGTPAGLPLTPLVELWSHSQVSAGARVTAALPSGQGVALEEALRGRLPEVLVEVRRRVEGERRIQSRERGLGLIAGPQTEWVTRHFADQTHSVSALDVLGVCAFRYFAARMLRLEQDEVPTLGPDAREQGRAAHAGLKVVYAELIRRGGLEAARADRGATWSWARESFDAHAEEILSEVEVHPALRAAALEDSWAMVVAQLGYDLTRDLGLEPVAVEYTFDDRAQGRSPALPIVAPDGHGRVLVRGSVDRIDLGGGALAVLDYKRSIRERAPGRHFQLPAYLLVALRDFGSAVSTVEASWVGLKDAFHSRAEDLPHEPAACREQIARTLWARIDRIRQGNVTPDPEDARDCKHCDFHRLCRYDAELDPVVGEDE